ncbi:hypothetical protein LSH36_669g02044 [Paralvinella palmiformis]|uniref:Uncharacterized protein n=1 Tax=Paralvinella palmiformis TaxID=53620 RepID=A0AAD9J3E0_9ANNE|nr:hypothetical protein LSH36_669g02044 [Paralvinella palmiformis]
MLQEEKGTRLQNPMELMEPVDDKSFDELIAELKQNEAKLDSELGIEKSTQAKVNGGESPPIAITQYNDTYQQTCPNGTVLLYTNETTQTTFCVYNCPSNLPFINDGQCVKRCGKEWRFYIEVDAGHRCLRQCPTNKKYYVTGVNKCTDECPYDLISKECLETCYPGKPFSYYGQFHDSDCYSKCPDETVQIENEYTCLDSCPPEHPVQLYGTCYSHFPTQIAVMLTAFTTFIIATIIAVIAYKVKGHRNRQGLEAELLNRLKEAVRLGFLSSAMRQDNGQQKTWGRFTRATSRLGVC